LETFELGGGLFSIGKFRKINQNRHLIKFRYQRK
jgi:hypothetical protein